MNEAGNDSRPRVAYHRGYQQPLEAKLARDSNAEWQRIDNEQKEASDAYKEAMAAVTKAFAENGSPTEGVLDDADEADQRVRAARTKVEKFLSTWRVSPS